ncbi:hypothetical protein [Nocardia brasiliensis]|uniref:hypothetical protein n=1 Tax=Nocardia brasiliensis TaxID=37326 RepID=UPI00366DB5B3
MTTVPRWTGREARALRDAQRLSVREFAAQGGQDARTFEVAHLLLRVPDAACDIDSAHDLLERRRAPRTGR